MTNSEINHNTLSGFDHGIEYYADQNYNRATKIRKNKITGGTSSNKTGHGIVVAPIKDPVGASTGENNSQNTINLKIRCNKIWYNELGIVGSGYLIDQISSTQPAGNMFNCSMIRLIHHQIPEIVNGISFGGTALLLLIGTIITRMLIINRILTCQILIQLTILSF